MAVMSVIPKIDYKQLCLNLLGAESEEEVRKLLEEHGLLAPAQWKVLGDMPNNRSMVDNQQNDPAGALVEKIINGMDAMLTKECFLKRIDPDSPKAPGNMLTAAEVFFGVKGGDLANLSARDLTKLAENIQLMATGTKSDPCYLIVDQGEGQTPDRFEDTFLSLKRTNKAKIHFVQGKFNCGGTGVLPFCGKNAYQLIISKRNPELPSGTRIGEARSASHSLWGFTLIRALPASQGIFDTKTYVYLAPGGKIPTFDTKEIKVLPEVNPVTLGDEIEGDGDSNGECEDANNTPRPYSRGLISGTIIKLYNYRWSSRGLATLEARFALEKYLYKLCVPFRIVEARTGYKAHYLATTVAGTAVTISNDGKKGYLESDPLGGEICPDGMGSLPIFIALYREKTEDLDKSEQSTKNKKSSKDPRRLPKGLSFTINGQVHYFVDSTFFVSRGLKYEFIKDTLVVVVDCTGLPEDVRDCLVMPSRDRLRKLPEFEQIIESVVADLKDREILRQINDQRKLRRVKAALEENATQDVFQQLVNKDPVLASLFGSGIRLRNPWAPGPVTKEYKGKLPPTFFHFEDGKNQIEKSFAIDRTCTVELETDAVNGYFELPDPEQRGVLTIEPRCIDRWSLLNGRLRIVFRAPSNAKIGDFLNVSITVTDPLLTLRGDAPWSNVVRLTFTEGGKVVTPGPVGKKKPAGGSLAMPDIRLVFKNEWLHHNFNEKSGLRVTKEEGGGYLYWVNMDNTYLHNELMQKKDAEKEATKFAYKWGLVLVAMGMLQELKGGSEANGSSNGSLETEEPVQETVEDLVCRTSSGVAAVIIPTVLHLMDAMKDVNSIEQQVS